MISCIVFDLDGVVRQFDDANRDAIEREHGLPAGTLLATASDRALYDDLVRGRLTREAWMTEIGARVGSPAAGAAWLADIGAPDHAVLDLVDELRAGGYTVAILTNGTDSIPAELAKLGIDTRVDAVFNSAEIGLAKPEPAVFRHVCQALAVAPDAVLFADDSARNVDGAVAVGMTAARFTGLDELRRDLAAAGVAVRRP